jgi:hypothetical protein
MHLGVEVLRGEIERNGSIVDDGKPIRQLDLIGLEIEQHILRGSRAGALVLRHRLVGLAILVDDEVNMRLLDAEIIHPNVRLRPHTRDVRDEGIDVHTHEDLVRGEIRRFPWTFRAVNHQPIGLNRKMPKAEREMSKLDASPCSVFKQRNDLGTGTPLKIRRRCVVPEAGKQHDNEQHQRAEEPL